MFRSCLRRNRAVNYLYFIERCDNHTIYHNLVNEIPQDDKSTFCRKPRGLWTSPVTSNKRESQCFWGFKTCAVRCKGPTTPLSPRSSGFSGITEPGNAPAASRSHGPQCGGVQSRVWNEARNCGLPW
ncbi:hypothetical protein OS493_005683 [Desmophyllum pertusum]|uniref:Uncharacterized protein n=1 Tax=Desmophyllum pertusum TaxID=174260 RepID=A0A9W9YSR6_9CNID|nr:hypothetical protein OS493_005683 [Desmophyllum pertusum]